MQRNDGDVIVLDGRRRKPDGSGRGGSRLLCGIVRDPTSMALAASSTIFVPALVVLRPLPWWLTAAAIAGAILAVACSVASGERDSG